VLRILLLFREFPFVCPPGTLRKRIKYNPQDQFHRHVKIVRDVLGSVVLSLGKDTNVGLVFPELDDSIFYKRKSTRPEVKKPVKSTLE
jgi:hypothetical protein